MRTAVELLDGHFREMKADFAAWCALYADDAVMEYPYGSYAGVASPLTGIAAISKSVKGFLDAVQDFHVKVSKVSRVEGEDAVFAEFSAEATVIATGRRYQQDYILYLRADAGKIVLLREYFDAPRVVAAFQP
ncbi:nuclear transport factor 2 family protein [Bradyrhizobium prioriisuperbiae]|uniref:nuclear transport factor 2 family protein n=1 Tax=Bradyrhizobium prioriisuperbiae TaxID=2854389 RepID=UPI0028E769E2|nr:nuclear transport factor 2 family protein [Bradyrhizobium prioritasuperba]